MPTTISISPRNRAIQRYYDELDRYYQHGVTHEMATRSAFQNLLGSLAHDADWILVPEQPLDNGKRPDGTLRDGFFTRGYWEAKDTHDDLRAEVRKKLAAGYPTLNTIFEDTEWAILYQDGLEVEQADLRQPDQLAQMLTAFFTHTKPEYDRFEKAVADFRDRIPSLATSLLTLIRQERAQSKAFQTAFATFWEECKRAIDPNITVAVMDEMLVQHLLTERLFRTVFQNQDFTRRNVIAREIERVVAALTSRAFDRSEFLRPLDNFYAAIEEAARSIASWSEKQHFLNTVYERFFQGYSVKSADTFGVNYTPQEIVDFMAASVEHILATDFGLTLGDHEVKVLDPCTGTGNFIVNLLRRVPLQAVREKYAEGLYANEVMLLPYYIAALNIEHAYYERTHEYRAFEGICFADTLTLEGAQMAMFTEENTTRVEREKAAPIMVVIGNPPYNAWQTNENDNNKNRRYPVIEQRVRETYAQDSTASNKNALSDPYVKFFRWATDRLQGRDGIVCFVSNNSFVDQLAFDGMRRHLLRDFTHVYHLDLHGNVRKNPKLSGTTHNVFGIQVGVGITIAVRLAQHTDRALYYYRVPEDWRRNQKLTFLSDRGSIAGVEWQRLEPDEKATWLTEGLRPEFDSAAFLPIGTREAKAVTAATVDVPAIFWNYGRGVATSRDNWTYDFDRDRLAQKVQRFIETYNAEVDRWNRRGSDTTSVDDFVPYDDKRIKWSRDLKLDLQRGHYAEYSEGKVRRSLYRPYCIQWLFFDRLLNEEVYQLPQFFPTADPATGNMAIIVSDHGHRAAFSALATDAIPNLHAVAAIDAFQCFPLYTYSESGDHRQENITDWALARFWAEYGSGITKRDIFHYVYAILHHPDYRTRYVENLKRDLPRIPLAPGQAAFATAVRIGAALAALHVGYEQAYEYPLTWRESPNVSPNWRVEKMRLSRDRDAVIVNDWLTLAGVPPACFEYQLGNRSALESVLDEYQVSTDARSGIISDPNRADDPEYIVRLVCRVVTVSIETVRLVRELAGGVSLGDFEAGEEAGAASGPESGSESGQSH